MAGQEECLSPTAEALVKLGGSEIHSRWVAVVDLIHSGRTLAKEGFPLMAQDRFADASIEASELYALGDNIQRTPGTNREYWEFAGYVKSVSLRLKTQALVNSSRLP